MSEDSKRSRYARLAWVVFLLLTVGEAGSSWGQDDENTLRLSITTSKAAYPLGEPIKLSLAVKNISEHHVTLTFASSKQYDFIVTREGHELWKWSNGQMFAMVLTRLVLDPQESRSFEADWLQTDRTGQQVQPGLYEVIGTLAVRSRLFSNSISFEIQASFPN